MFLAALTGHGATAGGNSVAAGNDEKDRAELVARRLIETQEQDCNRKFISKDRFSVIEKVVYAGILGGLGWVVAKIMGLIQH
jgi:hypothetical protein